MNRGIHHSGNGNKGRERMSWPPVIYVTNGRQTFVSDGEAKKVVGPATRFRRGLKPDEGDALTISARQFRDGTILELIEEPADTTRTLLAVRSGGTTTFVGEHERNGCRLVPFPRDNQIVEAIPLPDGIEEYGSAPQLARSVGDFLFRCAPISEGVKGILGAFVVCTWVPELLAHFPCLVALGPNDITIRLLRTLRLVCRHALLVGDATSAGILQACSRWQTTLLLFDYGLRSDVFRTLRAGVWDDMLTLQKSGLLSGFGPKLISAPEIPAGMEDCESVLAFSLVFGGPRARACSTAAKWRSTRNIFDGVCSVCGWIFWRQSNRCRVWGTSNRWLTLHRFAA